MLIKSVGNYMKVVSCKEGKLSAVASDATEDRDGEVILPAAFGKSLDRYRANPVILAAHTHRSLDGTPTIIGSATRIDVTQDALTFDMLFAKTPLAQQWQSLYEDGHARAFSVGFIPKEGEWKQAADGGRGVYVHTEVELLEISAVPVPANPNATARDVDEAQLRALIDDRIKKALGAMQVKRLLTLFHA